MWRQPIHFSLEWFGFKRNPFPTNGWLFMFWMSKKEMRHYKLLTLAEILDNKEGKVRSGTWACLPGCFLNA